MTDPKSIFVTGAARGIGAETVRLFLARGWQVGASDVDEEALAALGSDAASERLRIHPADVRDRDEMRFALGEFTQRAGGRLDSVFANAGVGSFGPDTGITPGQKDRMVDVNVRGVIHTIDAAFPHLARTPGARVVAMSSTSAEYGSPEHAVYSATKFFVRGLTEALDIEYRAHGIRVAGIYVPYVQTGMVYDAAVKPASIERLGVKIPPRRVAETVWRAVNDRHRVHWRVGLDAKLINAAVRLLGGGVAPIYARIMRG
jgi:NAD(P)-dependent dehydrogenase (short-subunit alcohol dehydrogenase family)